MTSWRTPFELGNHNQTTDWAQCIAFYERLAQAYPQVFQFKVIGLSDGGTPIHAGVISADGVFDSARIKQAGRTVFFNNNGIHPGEPEGIDSCMARVRDFCTRPDTLASLGDTVYLFIPIYNVDGCLQRGNTARADQVGPQAYGYRACSLGLDLNRDFIKADSLCTQAFIRLFVEWDPEVMVDTHTSNGADYSYTMTLIQTQADKLGGELGRYLREAMSPALFDAMAQRGHAMCPYVNPVRETPDDGIEDFADWPRYSTGFAALHHCIAFMPETHMLKPYAQRYAAMTALVDTVLAHTCAQGKHIQSLRQRDRGAQPAQWPVQWRVDKQQVSRFLFKGYAAVRSASTLGRYQRLSYDRQQPYEKYIDHYQRFETLAQVAAPRAYLIPQAWREVVQRLQLNGVQLQRVAQDQPLQGRVYRFTQVLRRAESFEGHWFVDELAFDTHVESCLAHAGDYLLDLAQPRARYAVETLEPQAHDSFFRWGFFNAILDKKEGYSNYAFEDTAMEMLQDEPDLAARFSAWKLQYPELTPQQDAVLGFIFENGQRHAEAPWRRYPVVGVIT